MFSVLVSGSARTWDGDQVMRMRADRFKEYSGTEAESISLDRPETLARLDDTPALLAYEVMLRDAPAEVVRVGRVYEVQVKGGVMTFRFAEEGRLPRKVVSDNIDLLGMENFELSRTHWAVKDGEFPKLVLEQVEPKQSARRQRLRRIRRLGEGAYGSVWLAQDTLLNRRVAVKFFKAAGQGVAEWLAQGRALARIDHPNVNKVHSVEEDIENWDTGESSCSALVLEYIDGPSLKDVLAGTPCPTRDQLRSYGTQIIDGLAAIHAQGLTHLDLHEENILIAKQRVYLIDIHYLSSLALLSTQPKRNRLRTDFNYLHIALTSLLTAADAPRTSVMQLTDLLVRQVFDFEVTRQAFMSGFAP